MAKSISMGIRLNGALRNMMRLTPPSSFTRNASSTNENPCASITEIPTEQLIWSNPGTPPWHANPTTRVYSSAAVTAFVNELKSEIVPGLPTTFEQTFKVFQDAGCLIYIHGGSVRDYLLGLYPKDIDLEYSCDPKILESACIESFGKESCHVSENSYFSLGEVTPSSSFEELEGIHWSYSIFGAPVTKEYTPNTLSYDLNGNNIIIDVIGYGVYDTCSRLIRIPVSQSNWWEWMTEGSKNDYGVSNGLKKLPRFWKLSSTPKSFTPADKDILSFITKNVRDLWYDQTYPVETAFRKFYCNLVGAELAADEKSGCLVGAPLNSDLSAKLDAYNIALENDMGSQWYNEFIVNGNVNKITIAETSDASTLEIGLLSFCIAGIGLAVNLL